jgi:hypothetical protein
MHSGKYHVLSANKQIDQQHAFYKEYASKCEAWQLSNEQIEGILKASKPIDGHAYHYDFDNLPCTYVGECTVKGRKAKYELNAGGVTTIFMADTTYWLGCYGKMIY